MYVCIDVENLVSGWAVEMRQTSIESINIS